MKRKNLEPFCKNGHAKFPSAKLMKAFSALFCCVLMWAYTSSASAQTLCPGGGFLFSSAVAMDSTWTNGCATGNSCSGGTSFDNRAACEPTTAIDPCVPAPANPGCTTTPNGSDLWFSFVAGQTTATINVVKNVSFFAVIQVFSGGPACGGLVDIGCTKSPTIATNATLNLVGLTMGQTYYFRVIGSALPSAQRTGTFCFCGSSGLTTPLPIILISFSARCDNKKVIVDWTTVSEINNNYFTLERSSDAINYETIGTVDGADNSNQTLTYSFTDADPLPGISYYRLKQTDFDGKFEYFNPATVTCNEDVLGISIYPNPTNTGKFTIAGTEKNADLIITNAVGETVFETTMVSDITEVVLDNPPSGVYFIYINSAKRSITKKIIFHP